MQVNEIIKNIPEWAAKEKWNCENKGHNQYRNLYQLTLSNDRKINLIIDKDTERMIIENSLTLPSGLSEGGVLSSQKYEFLYELKVNLLSMDIYLQMDPNSTSESIKIIHHVNFDELDRNKFFHWTYKMGDVVDLCIIMGKTFEEIHKNQPQ